jgi:hypothetical protein
MVILRAPAVRPGTDAMTEDRYTALTGGLLLVGAGSTLALHNAGLIDARVLVPWWPLLLLVQAGRALVARKGCGTGWGAASLWTLGAGLLLLHVQGYAVLRARVLVSIALIVGGAYLVWRGPRMSADRDGVA